MRCLILLFLIVICALSTAAQTDKPILLSESDSTRAIALESPSLMAEPFPVNSPLAWSEDGRTRIILFGLNLGLVSEDLSAITADAEDTEHHLFNLGVEYVGQVPGQDWLSAIVLVLNNDLGDAGDVLVRVTSHRIASNRVRVGIGHIGGGPPDDPGSAPTPPPPYVINGKITVNGAGLGGVALTLSGNQNGITRSDINGAYSFTIDRFGAYTITPSLLFYNFSPPSIVFDFLTGHRNDANFTALRIVYSVTGRITDQDSLGIGNVSVTLSGNSTTRTVITDAQGNYIFSGVEAGYHYKIAPLDNNVFIFTSADIPGLTSNIQADFRAKRHLYSLSGQVLEGTRPIGDATILLKYGYSEGTTTTDASGVYLFPYLEAGRNYTITPAKTDYGFNPESQLRTSLESNQTMDFVGTYNGPVHRYITGRIIDERGHGLANVTITVSGPETSIVRTGNDGTYGLTVRSPGNYTIMPSADQNYFSFSPQAQNLSISDSDRSADFLATLRLASNPSYVLEFDGTPKTVDCGFFWPANTPLGHFFWEFWAQPGENASATYLISDGYGGAHALLFGLGFFGGSESKRYELFGDMWDGSDVTYFSSDEGPAVGEWGHFAVGWDGSQVITYFNGVPVGRSPFAGPRISPGPAGGGGRLLIGGSDHSNLVGRIAQVRGYEERNPREGISVTSAFAPEAVFSAEGNYLGYFFRPSQNTADVSDYYHGRAHPGRLRGTLPPYGLLSICPDCPLPKFVIDPTAPDFTNSPVNNSATIVAGTSTPAGALIFDSFSRANSTYTFGQGGLGTTEGGSAGAQKWQLSQTTTGLKPFGILNGRAVVLTNEMALAWVLTGSSTGNLDIQVSRHVGRWGSGLDTGIAFRVHDSQNFFFAYTSGNPDDPANTRKLSVGYYLNGVRTLLASDVSVTASWTVLEVTTNKHGEIALSTDNRTVYSTNSSIMVNAAGAGLYNNGPSLGLLNRWDDFAVYDNP